MRGFVANTDFDWFTFLRAIEPPIDEVNFWKPGSRTNFAALIPGEPLFFKLKAPHHAIAGFGYFAHFSRLPVSMVWQVTARRTARARTGRCATGWSASARDSIETPIRNRISGSAAFS
jgi:putative restriction endonuclease